MECLLAQRILAIIGLGVIIGAADSWIRPTTISLKLESPAAANPSSQEPRMPKPAQPVPAQTPASDGSKPAAEVKGAEPTSSATPSPTVAPKPLGLMISAEEAKKLFDDGAVFLDARIESEFKAGHVPQAFHLNSSTFGTPAAADAMKALDPSQPAVIYCGGGDCDASKNLAILLQGAGFTKLHIFEAGFPDWEKHGYPVEKEKP